MAIFCILYNNVYIVLYVLSMKKEAASSTPLCVSIEKSYLFAHRYYERLEF